MVCCERSISIEVHHQQVNVHPKLRKTRETTSTKLPFTSNIHIALQCIHTLGVSVTLIQHVLKHVSTTTCGYTTITTDAGRRSRRRGEYDGRRNRITPQHRTASINSRCRIDDCNGY